MTGLGHPSPRWWHFTLKIKKIKFWVQNYKMPFFCGVWTTSHILFHYLHIAFLKQGWETGSCGTHCSKSPQDPKSLLPCSVLCKKKTLVASVGNVDSSSLLWTATSLLLTPFPPRADICENKNYENLPLGIFLELFDFWLFWSRLFWTIFSTAVVYWSRVGHFLFSWKIFWWLSLIICLIVSSITDLSWTRRES